MSSIVQQKVDQAAGILRETEIDVWLTFVRETTEAGDPVLPLILGQSLTWQSALLISATGERIAIVGSYEADAVRATGAWPEVVPYVEGIRAPLRETLRRLDPGVVAVNFSKDDVKSDGLTLGMYQLLQDHLSGQPFANMLISADKIIGSLRGRKSPAEIECMRRALALTHEIFAAAAGFAKIGSSEVEVAAFMKEMAQARGAGLAWDAAGCPIVNSGPDSMVGHGIPSAEICIEPGHLLHIDFGVMVEDYCSDLQRMWYVPGAGHAEVPEAVRSVFDAVRAAIESARAVLRPGARGWEVDAAARQTLVEAGYPEYGHATGHQVGRAAHDGGCVLGPRWERYGKTPDIRVEEGNVFTLELGVEDTDGRGYLGLEEMVLVSDRGAEYLSTPQKEMWVLG